MISNFMITQIGITAGDIWHYLDDKGSATLDELTKDLSQQKELILMSLGWLAREGHIAVAPAEEGFRSELIKEENKS